MQEQQRVVCPDKRNLVDDASNETRCGDVSKESAFN